MASFFSSQPPIAPTPQEVLENHRRIFENRVSDGTLRPLILPYHFYGYIVLGLYLCIRHTNRPILYKARWIVLAWIIWFEWKALFETSSRNMAFAFVAGLLSTYGIATSLTWLVFMRPQFDAKRVERRKDWRGQESNTDTHTNGITATSNEGGSDIRKRTQSNGITNGKVVKNPVTSNGKIKGKSEGNGDVEETEYYWQSYPDDMWERINWVSDLILNFRGPGWNWQVASIPPLPASVKAKLGEPIEASSSSSPKPEIHITRRTFFLSRIRAFIIRYLLLDILKYLMLKDPYFYLGPNTYALPTHLTMLSSNPILLTIYRELLSLAAILTSLSTAFLLSPILTPLLLGPHDLRNNPSYYPPSFGPLTSILTHGLAGLWSKSWHQIFRFVFSTPTIYLKSHKLLPASSPLLKKTITSLLAFSISGFLHLGGSITLIPTTKPLHPPLFFLLQALGIFLQTILTNLIQKYLISREKIPNWINQASNAGFALGWGLATGWILTDDFARGGIWLYEPIPVSFVRGVRGEGWWCWGWDWGVGLWKGGEGRWWERGVTI